MGGHCGNHVVKYTCKSYSRNGRQGRGKEGRVETEGGESRQKWHREREGGGQREKQGLSQVVHSAKQVLHKHTESKQSQSTVELMSQPIQDRKKTLIIIVKLISGLIFAYK